MWVPLKGPQTAALSTEADILFYGGAAGGGKTDLLIGLGLAQHIRSIIYRRQSVQLQGIYQRMTEILENRDGFNSQDKIWQIPTGQVGHVIEFGSCQHPGDEQAYQGRPHDLIAFDEITHFLESQFRFLLGWLRTTVPGQRCRVVCAGNPPTDSDGDWVLSFWGPWLNEDHPNPAEPGELRWYATIDGRDEEVASGESFYHGAELITPLSRTFIPSRIADNPYLVETGYMAQLQALPEPLRSQMLLGDFKAGKSDDPWQVIPTAWVRDAQSRWRERDRKDKMTGVGVDVARGGADETVISRRHGTWFDELLCYPGEATPDGPSGAALVVTATRDGAPVNVDVIGVGSSVYDHLASTGMDISGVNNANASKEKDESDQLGFKNVRAEHWWRMREALDPKSNDPICLPPGQDIRVDLCAPRYKLVAGGKIQIESKEELIKRIGRSPDKGDAVVMCWNTKAPKNWAPLQMPKRGVV